MVRSSSESQQTQAFSIDHENVMPAHYRLIELIGRGGMAEVYLAEDRRLGRKVAIKFLNQEFRRDPDRVRRFRQEARSASALNHPNILIIHDIGDRGGVQFIVSEFVEGETLGTRIAQGRVPFGEAVDLAIQVTSALSAAHSAGIVHRDIKPDNIMIRNDGVVKVLDFGLAKARGFTTLNGADFDATTLDSGSTSPGLIVGTPQYMSPEQARGKELDGRTDMFSLGIILFEMVTRHSPFAAGSFADTMAAILTKEPRKIEEFVENAPPRLIALVDRCLRKDPDERFASMAAVEAELKLLKTEVGSTQTNTSEVDPARSDRTEIRPTHQHSIRRFVSNTLHKPSPIAAVIILVAAGLLVSGWWAWNRYSLTAMAPALMRTVPITSWASSASELVTSASFSPDGKMVAFSARKGDSTEIWVKPVVGGDAVPVTKNGGYNQYPIWSPDGQEIAFFSNLDGTSGIWKTPFTGGSVVKILGGIEQSARPLRWGKDGQLYFESKRELFRVTPSGTEQLTNLRELGEIVNTIQISSDESSVAFSAKLETGWKLCVKELSANTIKTVGFSPEQIDFIAWHPDGQSVFVSSAIEGTLQIFEASLDGSIMAQRSNGDTNYVVHDVSQNGSVLYSSLSETSDLWKVDTETSEESIVANEVALEFWPDVANNGAVAYQFGTHSERPDWALVKTVGGTSAIRSSIDIPGFLPTWSNRGDWIAFLRRNERSYELWKSRPNGTEQVRLGESFGIPVLFSMAPYLLNASTNISWSPDDSRIAFAARDQTRWFVRVVETEKTGSGITLKSEESVSARESNPYWTDDGRAVISVSIARIGERQSEDEYRIYSTDLASAVAKQIYEGRGPIRLLGLSANGSDALFAVRTDKNNLTPTPSQTEIFAISIHGGVPRRLTTLESSYFYNIHLSRNGRKLAYVSRADNLTKLLTRDLVGGGEIQNVVINDPKILISNLGLSDDGRFIVFGKQTRTKLLSLLTY